MTKFYLVILPLLILVIFPTFVLSQSTPEQLETQKRLNEIESKRASSAASISAQTKSEEITFLEGVISSSSNPTIILSTNSGVKTIYTNDSTKFVNLDSKGKRLIGFGDLKIQENIYVIGLPKQSGKGIAKFIVRDQNPKVKYFSLLGKINEVKEGTLSLGDFKSSTLPSVKITLLPTTVMKGGPKTVLSTDLKIDDNLVVTGSVDEKGSLSATDIFIFSQ